MIALGNRLAGLLGLGIAGFFGAMLALALVLTAVVAIGAIIAGIVYEVATWFV